jgi:hypothetical protein
VHDALEQIVSCNHNLQQVHFSAVSCNHNLQQVHFSAVSCNHNLQQSSCTSLVQSQPAAGALFCSLMQSQPAAGALFLWWYQHGIHILHLGEVHDLQKSAPAAGLIHIAAFSARCNPTLLRPQLCLSHGESLVQIGCLAVGLDKKTHCSRVGHWH